MIYIPEKLYFFHQCIGTSFAKSTDGITYSPVVETAVHHFFIILHIAEKYT